MLSYIFKYVYGPRRGGLDGRRLLPLSHLKPQNVLCFMTLNGFQQTRFAIFKRDQWIHANVWLVQMNCRPEPGLNTADPEKPVT